MRLKKKQVVKKNSISSFSKVLLTVSVSASIIAIAYPSFADDITSRINTSNYFKHSNGNTAEPDTYLNYNVSGSSTIPLWDVANEQSIASVKEKQLTNIAQNASSCQDGENGLAAVVKNNLDINKQIDTTPVNIDNIFNQSSQTGCFSALHNFPDLSISIPSLSDMASAVASTLQKYATKKVCTAVDSTIENAITSLKNASGGVLNSGQIDLTGMANSKIQNSIYSVDKNVKLSDTAKTEQTYSFQW